MAIVEKLILICIEEVFATLISTTTCTSDGSTLHHPVLFRPQSPLPSAVPPSQSEDGFSLEVSCPAAIGENWGTGEEKYPG